MEAGRLCLKRIGCFRTCWIEFGIADRQERVTGMLFKQRDSNGCVDMSLKLYSGSLRSCSRTKKFSGDVASLTWIAST